MKHSLFVLITSVTLAHAGPEVWLQNGGITPEKITEMKPELSLTDEQEQKMKNIVNTAREKASPLEITVREKQKAFNEVLRQRDSSIENASAALTQLLEAEAPVKQLQLHTFIELRDVLSLEQQKQAMKLAAKNTGKSEGIAARVRQKAEKLRSAVESLGIKPTNAMSERGAEIEELLKAGDWAAADAKLDLLNQECRAEEPESSEVPDFSKFEMGNTDLEELRSRYSRIEDRGQSVLSLPLVRQFLKAKEALEQAKAEQDAEKVGRILTWAESELDKLESK